MYNYVGDIMQYEKEELIIDDLLETIDATNIEERYLKIYKSQNEKLKQIFAYYHKRINVLFEEMNERAHGYKYYLADDSRELLKIIKTINQYKSLLQNTKYAFEINDEYNRHLNYCLNFLRPYNGSTIPDDYKDIQITKYDPIFYMQNNIIKKNQTSSNIQLKMIGSGSFADVYKYKDDFYNIPFACKKLKTGYDKKELERFKKEFNYLNQINHPNILKAYCYINDKNEYVMEYCDFTLKKYYDLYNSNKEKLSFEHRKDIAKQFLSALSYLHSKDILHRDISYNNILLKQYDNELLLVKISDFGLIKEKESDLTSTGTELKGTIKDDTLDNFKNYNIKNEIYVIGVILFYIFTGKQNLVLDNSDLSKIIKKCIDRDYSKRYDNVNQIIEDINNINYENNKIVLKAKETSNSNLNALAKDMLFNAIKKDGYIIRAMSLSGLTIRCGNKIYKPNNAKEEADFEYIINILAQKDYIRDTGNKEIYKVTKKGFDLF